MVEYIHSELQINKGIGTISDINAAKLVEYMIESQSNSKILSAMILEGGEGVTWITDDIIRIPKLIVSVVLDPQKVNYPQLSNTVNKLEWCDFITLQYIQNWGGMKDKSFRLGSASSPLHGEEVDIIWVGTEIDNYRNEFAIRSWKLLRSGGIIIFSNAQQKNRINDILKEFVGKTVYEVREIHIHPSTKDGKKSTIIVVYKR